MARDFRASAQLAGFKARRVCSDPRIARAIGLDPDSARGPLGCPTLTAAGASREHWLTNASGHHGQIGMSREAKPSLDPLRRPALLRPDFLEPLETSGLQSSKPSHCICDALLPCHDLVS